MLTMTVNKFGTHILKETNMSYFCILPMILSTTTKNIKLPNGEKRYYYEINGDNKTFPFPLPELKVTRVDCNMSVEFLIKNKLFSSTDLIGQTLVSGDNISIIKPKGKPSTIRSICLGLLLKSQIQNE